MIVLYTIISIYLFQNASLLLFLNPPDPLRRMYTRSFFRATWVLTAMDAGFFKAMNIPWKPVRDLMSIVFTIGYLFFPDAANEQVKNYPPSVKVLRTAWEKSSNPYLRALTYFDRGYLTIRTNILIQRPIPASSSSFTPSSYSSSSSSIKDPLPPIKARLYYPKSKKDLSKETHLIFDIHGGGFVCMSPIHHDDYLSQICRNTRHPLVSIDYGKSPEHPYPWALEECFDAYRSVVESGGACIGMNMNLNSTSPVKHGFKKELKIVVMGDSAGGNLAAGLVMKIIEWRDQKKSMGGLELCLPVSVVLVYPCLSFELACWMAPDHMELLEHDTSQTKGLLRIVKSKTDIRLSEPLKGTDAPRKVNVESGTIDETPAWYKKYTSPVLAEFREDGPLIHSNLSMTSRMTFFHDRILGPEMMRSMALMYLAKSPLKPDVTKDYYLSPIMAPEFILAQFPKTFIMCGEKDPLVDDTVVIAAKMRHAKRRAHQEWLRLVLESQDWKSPLSPKHQFALDPDDQIKVKLLPGMSHGFLQFQTVLPEGRQAVKVLTGYIQESFHDANLLFDHDSTNGSFNDSIATIDGSTSRKVTSLVLGSLMNEIEEKGVLMRRRDSLASKLGFSDSAF